MRHLQAFDSFYGLAWMCRIPEALAAGIPQPTFHRPTFLRLNMPLNVMWLASVSGIPQIIMTLSFLPVYISPQAVIPISCPFPLIKIWQSHQICFHFCSCQWQLEIMMRQFSEKTAFPHSRLLFAHWMEGASPSALRDYLEKCDVIELQYAFELSDDRKFLYDRTSEITHSF